MSRPALRRGSRSLVAVLAVFIVPDARAQASTCGCEDVLDLQARYCSARGAIDEWKQQITWSEKNHDKKTGKPEPFTLEAKNQTSKCVDEVIGIYQKSFTGNTKNVIATRKAAAHTDPSSCKQGFEAPTACLRDVLEKHEGIHLKTCEAHTAPGASTDRDYGFIASFKAGFADWRYGTSVTSFIIEEISSYSREMADIVQKLTDLKDRCPRPFFEKPDGKGGFIFSLTPCPSPDLSTWDRKCERR
jgi:hypothetical protein